MKRNYIINLSISATFFSRSTLELQVYFADKLQLFMFTFEPPFFYLGRIMGQILSSFLSWTYPTYNCEKSCLHQKWDCHVVSGEGQDMGHIYGNGATSECHRHPLCPTAKVVRGRPGAFVIVWILQPFAPHPNRGKYRGYIVPCSQEESFW